MNDGLAIVLWIVAAAVGLLIQYYIIRTAVFAGLRAHTHWREGGEYAHEVAERRTKPAPSRPGDAPKSYGAPFEDNK